MTHWEYTTLSVKTTDFLHLEQVLNDLGPAGWELVTVVTTPMHAMEPASFRAILKRPVYENVPG